MTVVAVIRLNPPHYTLWRHKLRWFSKPSQT